MRAKETAERSIALGSIFGAGLISWAAGECRKGLIGEAEVNVYYPSATVIAFCRL
jgi:hypothetical protein